MRAAWLSTRGRQVVQVGHQSLSSGQAADAADFIRNGNLGRITAINAAMYRNTRAISRLGRGPSTPT